jgi:serine/threonine protein kinase
MVEPRENLPGQVLARTYRIERLLGSGGMGSVYLARNVRTDGLVAIKVLQREAAENPEIFRRFQEEARICSALRHPHIVQVMDFNQDDDGSQFIVMEYLEGEELNQRLKRQGRLALDETLNIAREVCSALQAAHDQGVVHRDIKPQNIFLARTELAHGITDIAKVLDFGISKIRRSDSQATRDLTILGTPQYMAPEAAQGRHSELDGRADQFALAVILYRALSGQLPFDSSDIMAVLYQVVHEAAPPLGPLAPLAPASVVAAVERAMAKRKEDRFPTMRQFIRALDKSDSPRAVTLRSGTSRLDSESATLAPTLASSASSLSLASGQPAQRSRRISRAWLFAIGGTLVGGAALTVALWPKPTPVQRQNFVPTAPVQVPDLAPPASVPTSVEPVAVPAVTPVDVPSGPRQPPATGKKAGTITERPSGRDHRNRARVSREDDDDMPLFPARRAK